MTTKRSELDPETLLAKLQAHGVERLRGEAHVWVVIDGSNLRKPYAQAMEYPQRVRRLDGAGTLPGYPTLNVIGIGRERRGLLDNKLYSSAAPTSGASRPRCGRRSARSGGALAHQRSASPTHRGPRRKDNRAVRFVETGEAARPGGAKPGLAPRRPLEAALTCCRGPSAIAPILRSPRPVEPTRLSVRPRHLRGQAALLPD